MCVCVRVCVTVSECWLKSLCVSWRLCFPKSKVQTQSQIQSCCYSDGYNTVIEKNHFFILIHYPGWCVSIWQDGLRQSSVPPFTRRVIISIGTRVIKNCSHTNSAADQGFCCNTPTKWCKGRRIGSHWGLQGSHWSPFTWARYKNPFSKTWILLELRKSYQICTFSSTLFSVQYFWLSASIMRLPFLYHLNSFSSCSLKANVCVCVCVPCNTFLTIKKEQDVVI